MNLLVFWPTAAACHSCIKPEAENPADAVFLAVHQPMALKRTSFATKLSELLPESRLLEDFLRDTPTGSVLVPILGESGIGKSHMIRWLEVQLRQLPDRDKRHVIRIPKSSSLKSVLGRLLEGLNGPRYDDIRRQIGSARERLDATRAAELVRAELLAAIKSKGREAIEKKARSKTGGPSLTEEDNRWLMHGDERYLPAILSDPATSRLFFEGVPGRPGIISELARHLSQDSIGEHAPRRWFERQDFGDPSDSPSYLSDAGPAARAYLQRLHRATNGKDAEDAVQLLNSILDASISHLATPSDTSLSELFYEIRKALLNEGRELVLLVEDFAVLAGVQQALLDAMIRQGVVNGKNEACIIRTALAVTDGYFERFETVETRAVYGWRIDAIDDAGDERTIDRITGLTAAYINAAAIGAERLELHYSRPGSAANPAPIARDFLSSDGQHDEELASFGFSADGRPLFPFNRDALAQLAQWKLSDANGRLRFHPRTIINEIILPVVRDCRDLFERGAFPPANFLGYPPTKIGADLKRKIDNRERDKDLRERYAQLIHFWGGAPQSPEEARIPATVYEAFGMRPLDPNDKAVPKPMPAVTSAATITVNSADPSMVPQVAVEASAIASAYPKPLLDLIARLDAWRSGDTLSQPDANNLRKLIRKRLLESVLWDTEMLAKLDEKSVLLETIFVPRTRTNNPANLDRALAVLATEEEFKDHTVANETFFAMRAMVRHDHHGNWDYADAEDDYAAVTNFVDRLLPKALNYLRSHYGGVHGDPVPALVQALLWQARALNVSAAMGKDDASLVEAVFAEVSPPTSLTGTDDWSRLKAEMIAYRPSLRKELLARVRSVQGVSGKTPYAIDIAAVMPAISELCRSWKLERKFPELSGSQVGEVEGVATHIKELVYRGQAKVDARIKEIMERSRVARRELGVDCDKNALLRAIGEVRELAERHGLSGQVRNAELTAITDTFRESAAIKTLQHIDAISQEADPGKKFAAAASLDVETHEVVLRFVDCCSRWLHERLETTAETNAFWTQEVVDSKCAEVDAILETLERNTREIGGVRP